MKPRIICYVIDFEVTHMLDDGHVGVHHRSCDLVNSMDLCSWINYCYMYIFHVLEKSNYKSCLNHVLTLLGPTEVVYILNYLLNFCLVFSHGFTCILHPSLYCSLLIYHIIVVWAAYHDFREPERLERSMAEWGRGPDCENIYGIRMHTTSCFHDLCHDWLVIELALGRLL